MKNKNKVIIIGGDHSNTLGVIRAFGENGIKPYLFVISNTVLVAIKKSKYLSDYWICKDEEEAILRMNTIFQDEEYKPVVIPTSDSAASVLDCNYERLSKKFILQNILNKNNYINKYMDKYEQFLFSQKYNIKMAQSQIMIEPFNKDSLSDNFSFPVIIKPLLSIDGKKEDIAIANDDLEFEDKLKFYHDNNYKRLLVQEFIDFDYECDMSGYCYDNKVSISGYVEKERIWPQKKGSLTFGKVRSYDSKKDEIKIIENIIIDLNYTGMFDVEFFIKGNDLYLNEINFRNSGLTYLYKNAYLCYNFYLSCVSHKHISSPKIKNEYFVMDEQAEIHQILDRNISIKKHFIDKKKSEMFLVKNKYDFKPSILLLFYKILKNLKLYNCIEKIFKIFHFSNVTYLLKASNEDIFTESLIDKSDYEIIEINKDNIDSLNSIENMKIDKNEFDNHVKGIVIKCNGDFVAKGFIKSKGVSDRFVNIINDNSYLFCNLYVNPKYRGKNFQCEIIKILINKYISCKKFNLYAVVYDYNIPSWRNLQKIGFKIEKKYQIIRFLKRSYRKERI